MRCSERERERDHSRQQRYRESERAGRLRRRRRRREEAEQAARERGSVQRATAWRGVWCKRTVAGQVFTLKRRGMGWKGRRRMG